MKVDFDALKQELLKGEFSSLTLHCDDFKSYYETAEMTLRHRDDWYSDDSFVSPEERARCIEQNTIWTLQWYPDTPVGFCVLHASSCDALLRAVMADRPTGEQPG